MDYCLREHCNSKSCNSKLLHCNCDTSRPKKSTCMQPTRRLLLLLLAYLRRCLCSCRLCIHLTSYIYKPCLFLQQLYCHIKHSRVAWPRTHTHTHTHTSFRDDVCCRWQCGGNWTYIPCQVLPSSLFRSPI